MKVKVTRWFIHVIANIFYQQQSQINFHKLKYKVEFSKQWRLSLIQHNGKLWIKVGRFLVLTLVIMFNLVILKSILFFGLKMKEDSYITYTKLIIIFMSDVTTIWVPESRISVTRSPVGRRRGPPPLSVIRGARSVIFNLSTPPLSFPPPMGKHQSAGCRGPRLQPASRPTTAWSRTTGRGILPPPPPGPT